MGRLVTGMILRAMTPRLAELWRYPVKSLRGERLETARVGADGIEGDRLVHVQEPGGRVVTSRYRPGLLGLTATLGDDGRPLIDGLPWASAEALARVRAASAPDVELVAFDGADHGQRYDVLPLTVLTDGMAEAIGVDHRRFRPNLFLTGMPGLAERDWPGGALHVGTCVIGVYRPRPRCVMTTYHPDTLEQDPAILRRIAREFGGTAALDCWVIEPGTVSVGDAVEVADLPDGVPTPSSNGDDWWPETARMVREASGAVERRKDEGTLEGGPIVDGLPVRDDHVPER
jgi:uncharacterized protein